ncbi:Ku protein [Cohnella lubricantis]|uniref:non-homologous end joining protein Ku n=1 Tax=Cohnella lubricantis TaxID=2163172 RepID=UPI001FDAC5C1|nr:Ku protein [Cohnella lubricantis]MBP2119453.1 DNA end-binding protein Ku [Cohnella lubricantis]
MHTVWKGAISFGLVHVPVKMFTATEDKDVHLRYIHKPCGTPISYTRTCPHCEKPTEWEEITRGYEYEKGRFVLFDDEELEAIKPETARTIQILDFVDLREIDPVYYQKTYYLSPDQAGGGAYNLLLEAMRQSGRIGIAKIAIRSKSSLAAIRVVDNCICLETMFYPDEIRGIQGVPNLPDNVQVNERELDMAKLLIDQLTGPFEPEKYTDDYRVALLEAIERKVAGESTDVVTAPAAERTNVIDLMAALQASLEATKPGAGAAAGAAAGGTAGGGAAAGSDEAAAGGARVARGGRARAGADAAAGSGMAASGGAGEPIVSDSGNAAETAKRKPAARRPAKTKVAAGAESAAGGGAKAGAGAAGGGKRGSARSKKEPAT